MKKSTLFLFLIVPVLFLSFSKKTINRGQTVNPIIGDISFVSKFGYQPDMTTNNELRVKTHLEYVENLLRQKDVSCLPKKLQNKRHHLLNLLQAYWTRGIFPGNYDYADQRKPCFIDKNNTICAVGYLIEQTTNRQVADEINSKHKYEEILAMNDNTVDNWISSSGLTKEECAMIQPSYAGTDNNYITAEYGISSSLLGGCNLALNTMNGIQIAKGANNKSVALVGLLTGGGQIALGAYMFKKAGRWPYANECHKTLSMVNMGLGTTTLILSAWNAFANNKPKEKLTTWNIYTFPESGKNNAFALSFARKF